MGRELRYSQLLSAVEIVDGDPVAGVRGCIRRAYVRDDTSGRKGPLCSRETKNEDVCPCIWDHTPPCLCVEAKAETS